MTRNGGCFCGAVRFRVEGTPLEVVHCHCKHCRRISGAALVTWVTYRNEQVAFEGATRRELQPRKGVTRTFCKDCGTPLTYANDRHPDHVDITVCSFDDPASFTPEFHVWHSRRLPWLHLADELPRWDERRERTEPDPENA